MAEASPQTPAQLNFTHRFSASRQRVYRAWTEPELLMKWFVESEGRVDKCDIDLRKGGKYRIEGSMKGKPWAIWGEYLEVMPAEKLVYTWRWDFDPEVGASVGDTVVTVEFRDAGKQTELTLTHERFESENARAGHERGWLGCFERLEKLV